MFPFIAGSSVCPSALCLLTLLWAGTGAGDGQGQLQGWERSALGRPGLNWAEIKPGLCLHCAAAWDGGCTSDWMWTKASLTHAGAGLSQLDTQVVKWVRPMVGGSPRWFLGGSWSQPG